MLRHLIVALFIFLALPVGAGAKPHTAPASERVRLPGHVLPALEKATPLPPDPSANKANEPMTLTLVLKRDDQAGFERYLHDVYDPQSKIYKHFLGQQEITKKFGPSRGAYDSVLDYLKKNGFEQAEGSANRLTLTVRGTRAEVEHTFALHISDYTIDHKSFYANDSNPAIPESMAQHVETVAGLANLATMSPNGNIVDVARAFHNNVCKIAAELKRIAYASDHPGKTQQEYDQKRDEYLRQCMALFPGQAGAYGVTGTFDPPPPAWQGVDGTGQTVGLVAFDSFPMSDVQDFINFIGHPAAQIKKLSQVHVNGGATPGPNQNEVLLDIDHILAIAPGANIIVFDAPFTGAGASFQNVFNAMINSGVTIISNSWAYCEDQTTLADVQGIDAILQTAAASGISVFTGSGDHGSTCLDGSPNVAHVPATSPHITAVGGTSLTVGSGYTYGGETWWNNGSGQGGFGISKFFTRPTYQDGLNHSPMRSIPDISANADPSHGVLICQASAGGCPTGLFNGGTSSSAPAWAAYTALLNQAQGSNLGFLNPLIYPFANTDAFHNAASMSTDFSHVGLGSANLARLHQRLTGQTTGPVSSSVSIVGTSIAENSSPPDLPGVPADGIFQAIVVVKLADANGNVVSGKSVSLAANGGHAQISPASGVSAAGDGTVIFTITDLTPETFTFTATNTTDGIVLDQKPSITFVTPPAANAGINAFPASVTADGISATTITLTLQDKLGRPTPGKLINLAQNGRSVISGPTPPVTDKNGQVQFTAVDQFPETVTYTATDVTDGNLPFPASGTVTFSGGVANGCGNGNPPAAPGFLVTPYATGFFAQNFSYGNVNYSGCPGAAGMAFDGSGNLYVSEAPTGKIYKFPPGGGVANTGTLLTGTPIGPSLGGLVFDKSGNLFGGRMATTGDFNTGAVLQINPSTGAVIRTVASGLTCPGAISIDPLSGDLFTDDSCNGAGSNNSSLWRISNPGGVSPATSVYATLPGTPNASLAFAPSGTLYVWSVSGANTQVLKVSGTNGPSTPVISVVPGLAPINLALLAGGTQPNGDAQFLAFSFPAQGNVPGGIGIADLTSNPPSLSQTLTTNNSGANLIKGPDGCLYAAQGNAVFRITDTAGVCKYTSTPPAPTIALSPTVISPNPAQGTSQTFSAGLHYVAAPAGTPVFFQVSGANPQIKMVRADAKGQASFNYTAVNAGQDTVVASATINTSSVTSNPASLTWTAGNHTTFLTLNPSPKGGTVGTPATVIASLTDISASPVVPLANEPVNFTLAADSCTASTDAKGIASCQLTPAMAGMETLTASFAGTKGFVASNDAAGFNVVAPPQSNIPPVSTPPVPTPPANVAPVANAGTDQTVMIGKLVTLNGTASYDPDNFPSPLSYAWTQTGGPKVDLIDAKTAKPHFTPTLAGAYTFTLVVNDGQADSMPNKVVITVPAPANLAPIANAGPAQTVTSGNLVTLDGSSSRDPDNGPAPLKYAWTQSAGPAVTLIGADTVKPGFTPTQLGIYTFQLVVNDGKDNSAPDSVVITVQAPANQAPIANAGPAQTVTSGNLVTLDGSSSRDPDNGPAPLIYAWAQSGGPAVTLTGANTVKPNFTPTQPGTYTFQLVVYDGKDNSAPDSVVITVQAPPKQAPIANAGPAQTVTGGNLVTLDGSSSRNPNHSPAPLKYAWTQSAGPAVTLTGADTVKPGFKPTQAGTYTFQLVVNDGKDSSAPASVVITVQAPINQAPIAKAGLAQTVKAGVKVTLNGSGSTDPNHSPATLSYQWSQTGGPTKVKLNGATTATPSFIPTLPGAYSFNLTVSDGAAKSPADSVAVTAQDVPVLVVSPNGGEVWKIGTTQTIQWYASSKLANMRKPLLIRISRNGGKKWTNLKRASAQANLFQWKPRLAHIGTHTRVRICLKPVGKRAKLVCADSNEDFTITK